MRYLKSEHLKFKRTILNKLLWIAPLFTAIFAWIVGGFMGFQYMTFYWWYAFLLPGTTAILCVLAHQKEERAGKYYSIRSLPIDLAKFEIAKCMILAEKLFISSLFLAAFVSIANLISPTMAVYSVGHSLVGSIGIVAAAFWQIPLCLYLSRKAGMMLSIILNALLGLFAPVVFGNTVLGWLCPYLWTAKLAESLMGIEVNGTFSGIASISATALIALALSLILFSFFVFLDARTFSKREG